MSAEEILLQQVWSMINEEHGEVLMSDNLQSRIESAFKVYASEYHAKEMERKLETTIMKFKDAPIGARFHFVDADAPKNVYVKLHEFEDGLVVKWNGNIQGHQSFCCWVDEQNGYDFDTEIEVI